MILVLEYLSIWFGLSVIVAAVIIQMLWRSGSTTRREGTSRR